MSDFWWSPENVETLEKLWREGLSAAQISARMGDTTRNAVIGKLHRLGLSGHGRVTVVRKPHAWRTPQARQRNIDAPRGHAAEAFRQRKREISSGARPVFAASAEPLPPPSETDIARVSFADLEDGMCKFIPGDPKASGPMFCGCKTVPGLSYCEAHARRCYQTPAVSVRVFEPTKELEHA